MSIIKIMMIFITMMINFNNIKKNNYLNNEIDDS